MCHQCNQENVWQSELKSVDLYNNFLLRTFALRINLRCVYITRPSSNNYWIPKTSTSQLFFWNIKHESLDDLMSLAEHFLATPVACVIPVSKVGILFQMVLLRLLTDVKNVTESHFFRGLFNHNTFLTRLSGATRHIREAYKRCESICFKKQANQHEFLEYITVIKSECNL